MLKKVGLASLAVWVLWEVLDFVIHGVLLQSTYAAQPELWRPMEEMKMGLLYFTVLVSAVCFVYVYAQFISPKSMNTAVKYGLIYGIGIGIGMAYGTYSVQPIPYNLALTWFLGAIVQTTLGGVLLGVLVKN
jgi:hypothetical protein